MLRCLNLIANKIQLPAFRPVLWLLLAVIWFGTLGARYIVDPDEGRYSEISREMALSGDWVTPRLNDLKYFEKPPLQYWASALAFRALGVNEFSARLWVGLCGFFSVLAIWFAARRLWSVSVADYAALICGGMLYIVALSHVVTLDMGVSFFLTLVLCGFLLAQHDAASEPETRRYMWFTWAAMAGAVLSKGLIGALIPGAVLVLYSVFCRDWRLWRRMHWLAGLTIFFVLALPWHLLAASRNPEWAEFYLVHEHITRFLTAEHRRVEPWYYFAPLLILGSLPWTAWLPAAMRAAWLADAAQFQVKRFLMLWVGFIFLFFSASGSKLPAYILPIFPAMVLLIAPVFAQAKSSTVKIHALVLLMFWLLLAIAAFMFGRNAISEGAPHHYQTMANWLIAGSLLAAGAGVVAVSMAVGNRRLPAVVAIAASGLLFLLCAMFGYQAYAPLRSAHDMVKMLQPNLPANTPIFSVNTYDQTFPFYLKRTVTLVDYVDEFALGQRQEPEKSIATLAEFAERWQREPYAVALMSEAAFQRVSSQYSLPMRIVAKTPRRILVEKR